MREQLISRMRYHSALRAQPMTLACALPPQDAPTFLTPATLQNHRRARRSSHLHLTRGPNQRLELEESYLLPVFDLLILALLELRMPFAFVEFPHRSIGLTEGQIWWPKARKSLIPAARWPYASGTGLTRFVIQVSWMSLQARRASNPLFRLIEHSLRGRLRQRLSP